MKMLQQRAKHKTSIVILPLLLLLPLPISSSPFPSCSTHLASRCLHHCALAFALRIKVRATPVLLLQAPIPGTWHQCVGRAECVYEREREKRGPYIATNERANQTLSLSLAFTISSCIFLSLHSFYIFSVSVCASVSVSIRPSVHPSIHPSFLLSFLLSPLRPSTSLYLAHLIRLHIKQLRSHIDVPAEDTCSDA